MELQENIGTEQSQSTYELRVGPRPEIRIFHNWKDAFWAFGKERVRCVLVQVFFLNGKTLRLVCRRKDRDGNVTF